MLKFDEFVNVWFVCLFVCFFYCFFLFCLSTSKGLFNAKI